MRRALLAFLLVGCSSSESGAPADAGEADSGAFDSMVEEIAVDTSEPPLDASAATDTAVVDAPTEAAVESKMAADLMFVGTSADRSAWICVHTFTTSDVKTTTPFASIGPIGVMDADYKLIGPLTFGQAITTRADATFTTALSGLWVVVAAHATKPDVCKDAWPTVVDSPADWVLVPPKMIPKGSNAAFTFGDQVRAYAVDAKPVSGAYVAQVINEGTDAALFELQRRTEGGDPIDTPVPLGAGKISSHAIGLATPLVLPTTASFAASDLVVDSTPLSLFAPSLARLTWAKDDGSGSLIVYAGSSSAPTIILVPWI
ncbi:MAG: hypothetical protein ACXWUG_20085 [Polyangiales bacterium]